MRLFFRFFRPRSWRSLSVWIPLISVGIISCVGLSLAMGFRSGALAQHDTATLRGGGSGFAPMTRTAGEPPLRSTWPVATGYGPLVVTVFWGEEGQQLDLPGIPDVEASGTVLASPAVLAQRQDDWTGEIGGWLGERSARALPREALAHPREMVIVEFTDTVSTEVASKSRFQPIRDVEGYGPETGFVIVGLLVLALPSIALARAGAAVHLTARSRRYGLLRVLGAPPRQLAAVIASDMAIPILAGALVGSAAYAVFMSSLDSFTVAGNSYWASDLALPVTLALALPLIVVLVGLASVVRMILRAGRDPVGTLRRERKPPSYLTYLSAVGIVAGPAAVFMSPDADPTLAPLLLIAGMLLSVVGLEGLSRIAVAAVGKLLVGQTRAQVAGSRMSRSGAEALLGVSATSVAVLLIVFSVYANILNLPPSTGDFDVLAELPNLESSRPIVRAMSDIEGVTRVVAVGRILVESDQEIGRLHTMTCDDARGSVKLDAPCTAGSIYLGQGLPDMNTVTLAAADLLPGSNSSPTDESVPGTYPVGGRVDASWITLERSAVVLMVDQPPIPHHTLLLVTTDGSPGSLRRVMEGLRSRPEESYPFTRAALEAGFLVPRDTNSMRLVLLPYLFVMATAAAAMAAVALLYAVLLLFRQRQAEFRMLRSQGATRLLLAVDLCVLFAAPLTLAFGLAVASGAALAVSYNTAYGVPAPQVNPQAISVLAFVLAIGLAATALVAGRAIRIPPLVTDPDAAAT